MLEEFNYTLMSLANSPDGSKIVSVSCDRTIKIWDFVTREYIKRLTEHTDYGNSIVHLTWYSESSI